MIEHTSVKEKKKQTSTKEWKKKVDSCLHSDSWRLDLYSRGSQVGDPWWSTCVCTCVSSCSSPFHPCSTQGRALSVSHSPPANSGRQTTQPVPHSLCHCLLTGPARAEPLSVTTFHLLYYNAVQEDVPDTCLHMINSSISFTTMWLLSSFSHHNVKYNIKLWIFYSEWNRQNEKPGSASSAVTAPFCGTGPG